MHIEERKEALCEKQFALYTCYLNGELNRSQYLRLIKPLDIEIDALEMFLKDKQPVRISLTNAANIDAIGFEHFNIVEPLFGFIVMFVCPVSDGA